jgi:hypothetical protein
MNAVIKLSLAACIIALSSYSAIAEDAPKESKAAIHGETLNLTPEQRTEARKEMREHVKNRTTAEERVKMHKAVKEQMVKKGHHGNGEMSPEQRSEARKEMREHVKNTTTPEQRNAMHQKVVAQMGKKSGAQDSKSDNKSDSKTAN